MSLITSVEINYDLTVKIFFFTDESVKGRITDFISENLTNLDLESICASCKKVFQIKTLLWPYFSYPISILTTFFSHPHINSDIELKL